MTGILALDTSSDSCSVALQSDSGIVQRLSLAPRQHNTLLFQLLEELIPRAQLRQSGVELLAFTQGPGSFTGLRIACCAVQGLAYANDLPVVGVSTLITQAQTALRENRVTADQYVLSMVDANVGEIYWSLVAFEHGIAREVHPPAVCAPEQLLLPESADRVVAIGSGLDYGDRLPAATRACIIAQIADISPQARDVIPVAEEMYQAGQILSPANIQPVYVRKEISWKKLSEQGKP